VPKIVLDWENLPNNVRVKFRTEHYPASAKRDRIYYQPDDLRLCYGIAHVEAYCNSPVDGGPSEEGHVFVVHVVGKVTRQKRTTLLLRLLETMCISWETIVVYESTGWVYHGQRYTADTPIRFLQSMTQNDSIWTFTNSFILLPSYPLASRISRSATNASLSTGC
jgi:hypothetical protein